MTPGELRELARRLMVRDAAAQGIEPVCADPAMLAAVAAMMRPAPSEREHDHAR
jgi:hypothetical protein